MLSQGCASGKPQNESKQETKNPYMHLASFIYYFNFPCFQLISQPFLTECQFRESAFNITTKSVTVQRWMFPDYL